MSKNMIDYDMEVIDALTVNEVIRLYNEGMSEKDIGKRLDMRMIRVRTIINRLIINPFIRQHANCGINTLCDKFNEISINRLRCQYNTVRSAIRTDDDTIKKLESTLSAKLKFSDKMKLLKVSDNTLKRYLDIMYEWKCHE